MFAESMRDELAARGIADTEFALGLRYLDDPPRTVVWAGVDFTAGFVGQRSLLILPAAATALLPAIWFGRFDPARAVVPAGPAPATATPPEPSPAYPMVSSPRTAPRRGHAFGRLLIGELRILVRGVSRWWWLGADRSPVRRALTQWLAGVALTALVGLGPGRADGGRRRPGGLAGRGCLIPTLVLALGVLGRTHRLFQAVYPPLWYAVVNNITSLDYLGALDGGPSPALVSAATALLLAAALAIVAARHG